MRRESSSAGKSSHHTSRHSRGTGSITYGIRTIVDKDPRFQSIPKTFRVPESEKVILPCYTENLGKEFYKVLTHYSTYYLDFLKCSKEFSVMNYILERY